MREEFTTQAVCQVCSDVLGSERIYCSRCLAPHHADCWVFNSGCAIFGCGGKSSRAEPPPERRSPEVLYIAGTEAPRSRTSPRAGGTRPRAWALPVAAAIAVNLIVFGVPSRQDSRPRLAVKAPAPPHGAPPIRTVLPLYEAVTVRDVKAPGGTISIPAGAPVKVFRADSDGRHRIEARDGEVRWVSPEFFVRPSRAGMTPLLSAGPKIPAIARGALAASFVLAQLVRNVDGLGRGELVIVLGEEPARVALRGMEISARIFWAVAENGRLVKLQPHDFERVPSTNPVAGLDEALALLRSAATLSAGNRPFHVILVDQSVQPEGLLPPGTIVRVLRAELSAGQTSFLLGATATGFVRVQASVCRPLLAPALLEAAGERP